MEALKLSSQPHVVLGVTTWDCVARDDFNPADHDQFAPFIWKKVSTLKLYDGKKEIKFVDLAGTFDRFKMWDNVEMSKTLILKSAK